MTNTFAEAFNKETTKTLTENQANVYSTTQDELLDLFANIGSLRSRTEEEIESKFAAAYAEDPLLAVKMAFYARNVRGGLGERRTFRIILKWLGNNAGDSFISNIPLVPEFGRWDDLYALVGTELEKYMWMVMGYQVINDMKAMEAGEKISLMAKWLKSEKASSAESKRLALLTAKHLGLTPKQYRKIIVSLRAYTNVTEVMMSANQWEKIKFEEVPSQAMSIYRNAFAKHTPEEFEKYVEALEEGETKVNAATLYPYEILERAELSHGWYGDTVGFSIKGDRLLEQQWKALPDYVGEGENFIVMADTSGSMSGRPMATSIGLATYFAERNTGPFKDMFMTFSSNPEFIKIKGDTLREKIHCIHSIISSTDLEKAFDSIVSLAINNNVMSKDMPKALVVISDGEIDHFTHSEESWSFLSNMERKFGDAGYVMPKVVMWNVASRADRYIDQIENPKIQFISGSSPSAFKSLINGVNFTAQELMLNVLNDEMYDSITL